MYMGVLVDRLATGRNCDWREKMALRRLLVALGLDANSGQLSKLGRAEIAK